MKPVPDVAFFVGVRNALLMSVPLWALILAGIWAAVN